MTRYIEGHDEFLKVQEELQDYEDLRCLREAKESEKNEPTIGIDELKKQIGNRNSRSTPRRKKQG